jgi:hypothetical protein
MLNPWWKILYITRHTSHHRRFLNQNKEVFDFDLIFVYPFSLCDNTISHNVMSLVL